MVKMKMTYHASIERADRLTNLIMTLGFNEIVYETIDKKHPDCKICITDTGIILIRNGQDGRLITGYMATVDKALAICKGNIPVSLKKTVVYNCKKYAYLLDI